MRSGGYRTVLQLFAFEVSIPMRNDRTGRCPAQLDSFASSGARTLCMNLVVEGRHGYYELTRAYFIDSIRSRTRSFGLA